MTSLLLGLRLALAPAARLRTGLLILAALLSSVVLLTTLAAGRFELDHAFAYQTEMPRLVLAVVVAIALPCAVLLATVARLSAALRDRRLGNLRLIGLTAGQTRYVAAAETGVAAATGGALGWLAFSLLRPVLVAHPPAGRTWDSSFGPSLPDQAAVLVGVPVLVILVSLLPTHATSRDPLAVARRADRTPPGWWRLAPLGVGTALCTVVIAQGHETSSEATERQAVLLFAGVGLSGIGLVLVLPVLVRLLTRALAGLPLGAASRVAVRRLESQPAAVARIIAALLVGLFLVTGARFVLVAFESTPQYLSAAYNVEHEERAAATVRHNLAPQAVEHLENDSEVRAVVDLPTLHFGRFGLQAVVGTCADLGRLGADISDCREGQAMWLGDDWSSFVRENFDLAENTPAITWKVGNGRHQVPVVSTDIDLPVADLGPGWEAAPVDADAIVPPELVGSMPDVTTHAIVVTGAPGTDLTDALFRADVGNAYAADRTEYDFVATMRGIIWTIAAVVLGIGLLSLAIATTDRAIQRRKEVVSLQLVGLGPGVVRRAQLLETAVPLTIGIGLAIGLGALAGATYLTLDETVGVPWAQTWRLAAVSVLGGLVITGACTLAATPRLRPEEIRAE